MALFQSGSKESKSLLAALLGELRSSTGDVAALLRQARILASELGNKELAEWALAELNGYNEGELPDYRRVFSPVHGTFTSPFARVSGVGIPISQLPEDMRETARTVPLGHSIKAIEEMARKEEEQHTAWPQEAVFIARRSVHMAGGYQLVELYQTVTQAMLAGVVDAVRNRLLEFVLALVELKPSLKRTDDDLSSLSPADVDRAFHLTIVGDGNVVATGHNIAQQLQSGVKADDLQSLLAFFQAKGVSDQDTKDLAEAVTQDGTRQRKTLGPKVAQWLGKLVGKAAEGSWKVAVETAPTLINKALAAYYGWSA